MGSDCWIDSWKYGTLILLGPPINLKDFRVSEAHFLMLFRYVFSETHFVVISGAFWLLFGSILEPLGTNLGGVGALAHTLRCRCGFTAICGARGEVQSSVGGGGAAPLRGR